MQLDKIIGLANKHKIIAIGEMHGVKENPEVTMEVYNALKGKYTVVLGFEYPQSLVNNLDSTDQIFYQDGRFSPFHKEMLERLKKDGVKIFGFDLNNSQFEEQKAGALDWRDKIMAENINSKLKEISPETKMLLVTGDIHYQTVPQSIIYPDREGVMKHTEYFPMGAQLETDSILAIHLRYLSGQFFNFKLRKMPKINADKNRSFRDSDDLVEIDIPEAHPTRTE
ncbi:MAG: hypothetical protein UW60_C0010G0002 [Candidatus Woesebacteria bacterium GW2011_GWA2_44_33]|uniref:Haem-binding uptake Tiki superfamily ChaN domain-containing protein n=1 Tax=Candidatus Woesebacteria bacterium GW2011_GWA2_44_33 TaxID=1618564 RepID=A0A0G1M5Q3_9BACT|nr:MAG: hypothetical protein UW60_C0010G0002 [Candidatus Woesebacteria bacterium GW2011_GWA2_44_33]